MKLAAEIIYALLLIAGWYTAVILYLREKKIGDLPKTDLRPNSRGRILYLVLAVAINIALIVSFRLLYESYGLLHHMRLLTLVNVLIALAAVDHRVYKIPNVMLIAALVLRALFYAAEFLRSAAAAWQDMKGDLIAAAILIAFFLLLAVLFKNSIGMGDIKLMGVMGIYQGIWGSVNAVFYSLIVSFFVALILLITKRKNRKDMIPFGPCIMLGTTFSMILTGI